MYELRQYQTDWIAGLREQLRTNQRVLGVLPTGGGKTVCFAYIAHAAARKQTRTCICVHRRELLNQTVRALNEMQVSHGVIAPGVRPRRSCIQVASIQTLVRRPEHRFDFLVLDEGHHAVAGTWERVLQNNPGAKVLGVTATPCRLSGRGLGHVYQSILIGPSISDLIEQQFLTPPRVYAPAVDVDASAFHSVGGDYNRDETAAVMDRSVITGSAVEHYHRLADRQPAIAFCVSIEHAEHVAQEFRAAGYRAASIDGKISPETRDTLIRKLADGRLHVLTSCDLISEGVDVPVVSCGILLRPTKSTALYLQQVGRCLRTAPGKTHAIILDHAGNTLRHGLPDDDRKWSLSDGIEAEQKAITVWTCPVCLAAHRPAAECPECGYVYPPKPAEEKRLPKQREGQLYEVLRGEQVPLPGSELTAITPEQRDALVNEARTLSELHDVARKLGYSSGWAWQKWQSRRKSRRQQDKEASYASA